MTAASAITAVIFDCDGVLIDSEVLSLEIEMALLAECGLSYEIPDYKQRFMGLPAKAYLAELTADSIARTGRPLPEDIEPRHRALFRKACEERLRAIAGARALADSLPHPKAVASSSSERGLSWKLGLTGLHDAFAPHIYSAQHVERGKPAPDLFLFAADKIGADPQTTLVIEDSRNGILAAKAGGMIAAGLTAGAHCDDDHAEMLIAAGADHVFDSHGAIAGFLGYELSGQST